MTKELPTIPFDDFAKRLPLIFDRVLRQREPVLVERDGALYRLEPEPATLHTADPNDIWANYNPTKVAAALNQAVGALADVDRRTLLDDLHAQREQDSEGRPAT